MTRCPRCGNPLSQLIAPDSPTRLLPIATLACVGIDTSSCGWTLGYWIEPEALEEVAELMEMEPITL